MRLLFWRLWVRIPALYNGLTFFHIYLLKICLIEKTQINEKEAWYGEFKIRIFQTIQIFVELFFYISSLANIIENNCIADISCTGNFTFIWNRTYVSVCAEFVWTKLTYTTYVKITQLNGSFTVLNRQWLNISFLYYRFTISWFKNGQPRPLFHL